MYNVFADDFSMAYGDVYKVEDYLVGAEPADMPSYKEPKSLSLPSYGAQVVSILPNDSSFAATEYYINAATESLYSEQQSLNSTY